MKHLATIKARKVNGNVILTNEIEVKQHADGSIIFYDEYTDSPAIHPDDFIEIARQVAVDMGRIGAVDDHI